VPANDRQLRESGIRANNDYALEKTQVFSSKRKKEKVREEFKWDFHHKAVTDVVI